MGTSDLPEIYTRARGGSLSVYSSGKLQVPMLQLMYSTWGDSLASAGNCRNVLRVYLYGPCEFRLWIMS